MRLTLLMLLAFVAALLAGCGSKQPRDTTPSEPTAVDAVLAVRWDTARAAFSALSSGQVLEDQLVEAWAEDGERSFIRYARLRDAGTVVSSAGLDSSGSFRSSWTSRLAGAPGSVAAPFEHWLDAEPPYQSGRRRDDYRFEVLPDTNLDDTVVQRYRVVSRDPGATALQSVTFLTTGSERQVIGFEETRRERAPFFKQDSRLRVAMRHQTRGWTPAVVELDLTIDAPARKPRRFRVETTYVGSP